MKNVTSIYRSHGRHVESLRQTAQRNPFSFPVEEMIQRLGRFDLSQDLTLPLDSNGTREAADRNSTLLTRILTLRGMRAEQTPIAPPDDIVDLTQSGTTSPDVGSARRLHQLILRRSSAHSSISSALNSAERLVETYFRSHPAGRNQEQPQPVDDRDSFSSIAAVINSESQMDTIVEIDSMVSLSTSSSRRRHDASRILDVDSGDSRAPRRRRLN